MLASVSSRCSLTQSSACSQQRVSSCTRLQFRHTALRAQRVVRIAAAAATKEQEPVVVETSTPASTFSKYFSSLGWEKAWVDVVTDRLIRADPKPIEEQVGKIIMLLKDVGIPMQSICNMAAISHEMLCGTATQAKAVVDYCKKRGVSGDALVALLESHPKLLTYELAGGGERLSKGKTQAQVDVMTINGKEKAVVSMWRQGTAFESPVSPLKPKGL